MRNEAERRVEVGESAIGSFEEVARRWLGWRATSVLGPALGIAASEEAIAAGL